MPTADDPGRSPPPAAAPAASPVIEQAAPPGEVAASGTDMPAPVDAVTGAADRIEPPDDASPDALSDLTELLASLGSQASLESLTDHLLQPSPARPGELADAAAVSDILRSVFALPDTYALSPGKRGAPPQTVTSDIGDRLASAGLMSLLLGVVAGSEDEAFGRLPDRHAANLAVHAEDDDRPTAPLAGIPRSRSISDGLGTPDHDRPGAIQTALARPGDGPAAAGSSASRPTLDEAIRHVIDPPEPGIARVEVSTLGGEAGSMPGTAAAPVATRGARPPQPADQGPESSPPDPSRDGSTDGNGKKADDRHPDGGDGQDPCHPAPRIPPDGGEADHDERNHPHGDQPPGPPPVAVSEASGGHGRGAMGAAAGPRGSSPAAPDGRHPISSGAAEAPSEENGGEPSSGSWAGVKYPAPVELGGANIDYGPPGGGLPHGTATFLLQVLSAPQAGTLAEAASLFLAHDGGPAGETDPGDMHPSVPHPAPASHPSPGPPAESHDPWSFGDSHGWHDGDHGLHGDGH
jgi:hypothetical protein